MNLTAELEHESRTFRPIWLRAWVAVFLVLMTLLTAWMFHVYRAQNELNAVLDKTDRLDPGWRLQDIEARLVRQQEIADQRSVELARAACDQAPRRPWPWWPFPQYDNDKVTAQLARRAMTSSLYGFSQLNDEQLRVLRSELGRAEVVLQNLRRLPGLPAYPLAEGSPTWRLLEQNEFLFKSALEYDAELRAHENDMAGAMIDVRASLTLGRLKGDVPSFTAQVRRLNSQGRGTVHFLHRVLSMGEATDADLATVQQELEQEAATPFMLVALRGERGHADWVLEQLQKHSISMAGAEELLRNRYGFVLASNLASGHLGTRLRQYLEVRTARAGLLRAWLPIIELARLEPAERLAKLPRTKSELASAASSWHELMIFPSPQIYDYLKEEALVRRALYAAASALAAERFRMAHGHWPTQFEDLVPQFLTKVPTALKDSSTTWPIREGSTFRIGEFVLHDVDQRPQPAKPWVFPVEK